MRSYYEEILKHYFYHDLIHTRMDMHLTQPQMADLLKMGVRAYIDLDHGKHGCSGLTLARYLVYCSPNPMAFLDGLCSVFEAETEHTQRRSEALHPDSPISYRQALPVTQSTFTENRKRLPFCPRCRKTIEEKRPNYCSNCGQKLSWHQYGSPFLRLKH